MKVAFHANICDLQTKEICDRLRAPFRDLSERLSQEYGGAMEHLWIDFELVASHAERRPPFPFRYQKRVSGRSKLTGIHQPDSLNVAHYSVRPDFGVLLQTTDVVGYALQLMYDSTAVLLTKQKRLGGFDAPKFRSDFLDGCRELGYELFASSDQHP